MKMNVLIAILLCSACMLSACSSAPKITPLEGYSTDIASAQDSFFSNPLNVSNIGDPFILAASDGKYYMYATSASTGFKVWRSDDMISWSELPELCYSNISGWESRDFWAPEVFEVNEKYYLYYSARWRENGSLRLGAAVSDKPEGPFEPLGDGPILDYGYAAIDSHLFIDDDGSKTFFFVRDCSENIVDGKAQSHIYAVPLADDMISAAGDPVLLTKPDQDWELLSDPQWNEGPYVIKNDDKYYLMYSGDYYGGRDYSVGYAVADSVLGPYVKYENNPILKANRPDISGTGHNMVLKDHDGQLYCVYHSHSVPIIGGGNRQLCIDRMGFNEDGTMYIDGPTITPQRKPGVANLAESAQKSEDGLSLTWDQPITATTVAIYAHGGTVRLILENAQTEPIILPDDPFEPFILTLNSPMEITKLQITVEGEQSVQIREILVI